MSDIEELDRQGLRSVIVAKPSTKGASPSKTSRDACQTHNPLPRDIRDGQTVKGINFVGLRQVGAVPWSWVRNTPPKGPTNWSITRHQRLGGGTPHSFTELVARIDLRSASSTSRSPSEAASSSVDDASRLLDAGADKITLNSAAVANPSLIDAIAARYGSQFVVAAIDARTVDGRWSSRPTEADAPPSANSSPGAAEAAAAGAGEILFTSMDHDGTKNGYPCDTVAAAGGTARPDHRLGRRGPRADHIADVLTLGRGRRRRWPPASSITTRFRYPY